MRLSSVCSDKKGADFDEYFNIRNEILEKNMNLIKFKARRFACSVEDTKELVQEGVLGMIRAIEKYNPEKDSKFITYSYYHVSKKMNLAVRNLDITKKKGYLEDVSKLIKKTYDAMEQEEFADVDLLIKNGPITAERILKRIKFDGKNKRTTVRWISPELEKIMYDSKFPYKRGLLGCSEAEIDETNAGFYYVLNNMIEMELRPVNVRTAESIKMRFGIDNYETPMTCSEIGAIMGVSQQHVDDMIKKRLNSQDQDDQ
jgi:RNA polymerase sigma factor (sigma-70 family)